MPGDASQGCQRGVADWAGNIVAFVLVITANAMANIVPLGGKTTGEVSALYPSLFTPAGFTFGIWALIYSALTLFIVYQALPGQHGNERIARISGWFKVNCAGNALWIFAWHYDFIWMSLALMLVILATLLLMYRSLAIVDRSAPLAERCLLQFPISLYTGWISVALIANISAVQTAMDWNNVGLDAITWTLLKIAVAAVVASTVITQRRDRVFVLVIAWAAYGISVGQAATPAVAGAATLAMMFGVLLVLLETGRRLRSR